MYLTAELSGPACPACPELSRGERSLGERSLGEQALSLSALRLSSGSMLSRVVASKAASNGSGCSEWLGGQDFHNADNIGRWSTVVTRQPIYFKD
jgi:hypothetical protein